MKLTKEIALWYKDKVIEIGNLNFAFSVEGPKVKSSTYQLGSIRRYY